MNALAQPVEPAEPVPLVAQPAAVALLRTLVLCDLVNSTALVERLGDQRAAELFRKHDRLARVLLSTHGGREIDKTDGFLLMFDRPVQAVAFALDYQRALKQLGSSEAAPLAARVGVHVGDVVAWDNAADDIAKGAKPIEIEGLVKPITSRLMQLALPNQILLSGVAYALAHRAQGELGSQLEKIRWRTHGRYRFKGIPDPIPVFEVGEEGFAPLKAPPWSGKAHREVPFWRRPATLGIELFVLFALLAIPAWYLLKSEPAIAFAQRDWVVVGDLKNLTGETAFDDSIGTAFRIGLEQSRYVNVLSDLKTRETIKLMQRDPDATTVDRAVGSEIAIRDGARALILPTIAEIGGRVRITAEVVDPVTQTTVYSESADGVGEASVLPSLDAVNQKLRVRFGEALATVSKESQPLEKVATRNLDALRAYSLAEKAYDSQRGDAIALFEQALKIDPEFSLARIGLARALIVVDQAAEAKLQIDRAAANRARLSARDALHVEAWKATFGPPMQALAKWKLLADMYPDFFPGSGGYAFFAWQTANRFDDATKAIQNSAVSLNPKRGVSDYLQGILLLGNERYAEALASFERADKLGSAQQKELYASTYAVERKFDQAGRTLESGTTSDVATEAIGSYVTRIAFDVDQGNWTEAMLALTLAKQKAQTLGDHHLRRFQAIELTLIALAEPGARQPALLEQHLTSAMRQLKQPTDANYADSAFHVLLIGYVAARADAVATASKALAVVPPEIIDGGYPLLKQMSVIARAELLRSQKDGRGASALLKGIIDGNELYVAHVALMDSCDASGDRACALSEATWLAGHRGRAYAEHNAQRAITPFNVAWSNLALLRSAELLLALGRHDEAQRKLDEFARAWPVDAQHSFVVPRMENLAKRLQRP